MIDNSSLAQATEESAVRLYHAVPHDQFGSRLYPLETLRSLAPDAYLEAVAKYQDDPRRANIPSRRIAKLDCTTAEAINLSPVDPRLIHRAWRDLGVDVGSAHWYAIPVDRVRTLPTVITRPDPSADRAVNGRVNRPTTNHLGRVGR
jgi:hypothetical protein